MESCMENEITHCLFCGTFLNPVKGRSKRKFCNDNHKNAYHNAKKQSIDAEIIRINKILAINFDILKNALEQSDRNSASMSKEEMFRLGFSFDYYTQVKNDYKFCYKYGYTPKDERFITIVRGFDNIVRKI